MPDLILEDKDRSKLDTIVSQMVANKESDDAIHFVVNDFKNKYGKQSNIPQMFPPVHERAVSESTKPNLAPASTGVQELHKVLPAMKKQAVKSIALNNLQKQGKMSLEGSNDLKNEMANVEQNISDQDWMPHYFTQETNDQIKSKAIEDYSALNKEDANQVKHKLDSGEYILEDGKVKRKGGIIDNFMQGGTDALKNIKLGLDVAGAPTDNEKKYHINEFLKDKRYSNEVAATDGFSKAAKVGGGLTPYVLPSAVGLPLADIPLMGMSNMGSAIQDVWHDDKFKNDDERINAINQGQTNSFMTGAAQGLAFHSIHGEPAPTANSLLKEYLPTNKIKYKFAQNFYNNLGQLAKTKPMDMAKVGGVFAGNELANQLNKNVVGGTPDFSKVPDAALEGGLFDLYMTAPKVLAGAYNTLKEATSRGVDKISPQWFNSYSKETQDALNKIVSAPQPMYEQMMAQLDNAKDPSTVADAKQKIETFRNYYNSLPADLPAKAKDKALHILQLKTEAVNEAKNAPDEGIAKMYEARASAYDGLLQKLVTEGDVDVKKEPLLIDRFKKPIVQEVKPKVETAPIEMGYEAPKEDSDHATKPSVILPESNTKPNVIEPIQPQDKASQEGENKAEENNLGKNQQEHQEKELIEPTALGGVKDVKLKEGQKVGARLNLNIRKATGKNVLSIHDKSFSGKVLGHKNAVVLKNVQFNVNESAANKIASGESSKFPMASVDGEYVNADNYNKDGIELFFNPKNNKKFVDADGNEVKSADEATLIGNKVYARGVKYVKPEVTDVGDYGFHGGNLKEKSDYLLSHYRGDMPFTGHYFFSDRERAEARGNRSTGEKEIRVADFSKYKLLKPTTREYWAIKTGLKKFEDKLLRNDGDVKAAFNSLEDWGGMKEGAPKLYKEMIANRTKLEQATKEWYNELSTKNSHEWEMERLETRLLKEMGYEGVDVRGLKEQDGEASPDSASHGSVIFDIKPDSIVIDPATKDNKKNDNPQNNGATGETTSPVSSNTALPEGQVHQGGVQESVDGTGRGATETTPTLLNENQNPNTNGKDNQAISEAKGREDVLTNDNNGAGNAAPPVEPATVVAKEPNGKTELSLKGLQETAEEFGLPDVKRRTPKSDEQLRKNVAKTIDGWVAEGSYAKNIEKLIKQASEGHLTDEERLTLEYHLATIKEQARNLDKNSPEYDAKLKEIKRLKDAGQIARSEAGAALRLPVGGGSNPVENLEDAMVAKMEDNGVDVLTEKQKSEVEGLVEKYKNRAEEEKQLREQLEEKYKQMLAEKELQKTKSSATPNKKKSKDDYQKERENILNSIKDKWNKAGNDGTLNALPVPYAKQLAAIAPDVAKLVKSLVEEGIDKLEDVIKNVHETVKGVIPEITEKDVQDVIAGVYNEKKETRNELSAKVYELTREAKMLNELAALERGEVPEKRTVKKNQKLADLRKQINDLRKDLGLNELDLSDEQKIQNLIKSNERTAAKLKERIVKKDFDTSKPTSPLDDPEFRDKHHDLYKKALNAKVAVQEARHEFDIARLKDQEAKRSDMQKFLGFLRKAAASTQALAAGIDDSFMFVQAGYTLMRNPRTAVKLAIKDGKLVVGGAIKEHILDAWSEKRFNRELSRLHSSPVWDLISKSGLDVLEPQSLIEAKKEEMFAHNYLDKIGTKKANLGKFTKIFERAYTSLGNNIRVDLFLKRAEQLMAEGKTMENSPQEFKDAAKVINNLTGRGTIHPKLGAITPIITPVIWSPKMIASSINLLGLSDIGTMGQAGFYKKLTPSARKFAVSQMVGGISIAAGIMAAAAFGGAKVDSDPRSVTFGDIQAGNKSYNVFGRYASMMRLVMQMVIGRKSTTGRVEDVGEAGGKTRGQLGGSFLRGKMTPISGVAFDYAFNDKKDFFTKKPITPTSALVQTTAPMSFRNIYDGLKKDGAIHLLNDFIPQFVGINVKDQRDFFSNQFSGTKLGDFLENNRIRVPEPTVITQKDVKHPDGKLSDKEIEDIVKAKDEYLKKALELAVEKNSLKEKPEAQEDNQKEVKRLAEKALDKAKEKVLGKKEKTYDEQIKEAEQRAEHKEFDAEAFDQ